MAYTCACKVVRDGEVLDVIDRGASTVDEVADRSGAGTKCGGCLPTIEAMLALAEGPRRAELPPVAAPVRNATA